MSHTYMYTYVNTIGLRKIKTHKDIVGMYLDETFPISFIFYRPTFPPGEKICINGQVG